MQIGVILGKHVRGQLDEHSGALVLFLILYRFNVCNCWHRENEFVKAVYCHPAYLTYMQSTSREMLDWMKHKLESRLPREISITSDMQMTPPLWQKVKRN